MDAAPEQIVNCGGQLTMSLADIGWDSFFDHHFEPFRQAGWLPARVAREHRELYDVRLDEGELAARVSGRMRHLAQSRSDFPTVGDWVAVEPRPEDGDATIHALLPRKSRFCRKVAALRTEEQVVAANIDTVFLVTGLDANFNLRRIERYLTVARDSGAEPVVVLNKVDLCPEPDPLIDEARTVAAGVPVCAISAATGQGLDALRPYVGAGSTAALLGSSGVGKTTIINSLTGRDALKTGEVRQADGRGRHVTTWKELIELPGAGVIIDTPGMRELQLWGDGDGLRGSFEEIEDLARRCRFRDCRHEKEPGCAVKEALEQGSLDADRYKSYLKLRRELAYLSVRKDQRARFNERTRLKQIAKWSRQREKHHPKARFQG
jgi:ribosome biogenesis GTPase